MSPHTVTFQRSLIRLAKSAIALWEQWLEAAEKA
jgi:hypothetical protein